MNADNLSKAERLIALLDHLGLAAAHFATQMPLDVSELAASHPERMGGLVLLVPTRLDPDPFAAVAARTLVVSGDRGQIQQAIDRALPAMPGTRKHVFEGYEATGWSDIARDHGDALVAAMTQFLRSVEPPAPAPPSGGTMSPSTGTHAGLTYRISGSGPALILSPFFLAPSQWDPVEASLAGHFTVIRIGGAHVGGVAALEDRARGPSYRNMMTNLADVAGAREGQSILDVGCGSGALARLLAKQLGPSARVDAVDVNGYLMAEGNELARSEGLGDRIRFHTGSAEKLPFPDSSFDCALTVTVLEECDAKQAIREMMRVTRPAGRIGIIVRAIDMPQWWSMDLDPALSERANKPPPSVAPLGVADKRLYAMMRQAGLQDLVIFPQLVTLDRPGGTIWRYREDHVLSQLDATERARWQELAKAATSTTGNVQAHPMHCAVGTKPAT
ncbi:MAG: methyltransferase domain-containing protein [Hyphomicrobiaceae bacterium]